MSKILKDISGTYIRYNPSPISFYYYYELFGQGMDWHFARNWLHMPSNLVHTYVKQLVAPLHPKLHNVKTSYWTNGLNSLIFRFVLASKIRNHQFTENCFHRIIWFSPDQGGWGGDEAGQEVIGHRQEEERPQVQNFGSFWNIDKELSRVQNLGMDLQYV